MRKRTEKRSLHEPGSKEEPYCFTTSNKMVRERVRMSWDSSEKREKNL